jgi:hypothetical protein
MFDDLFNSQLWGTTTKLLNLIMTSIGSSKLHVVALVLREDEDGLP